MRKTDKILKKENLERKFVLLKYFTRQKYNMKVGAWN